MEEWCYIIGGSLSAVSVQYLRQSMKELILQRKGPDGNLGTAMLLPVGHTIGILVPCMEHCLKGYASGASGVGEVNRHDGADLRDSGSYRIFGHACPFYSHSERVGKANAGSVRGTCGAGNPFWLPVLSLAKPCL